MKAFLPPTTLILMLACWWLPQTAAAQSETLVVPVAADGVQRAEVIVDSYSFSPKRLVVREGLPVELTLKSMSRIVPHDFVVRAPEAGLDVAADTPPGQTVTVRFVPTRAGEFKFLCSKKLLFFESHVDKGMVGILEVRK